MTKMSSIWLGKNTAVKAPLESQMLFSWNKTWGLVSFCWRTVPGNMLYWLWWNYSDQSDLRPGVISQSLITAVKTFLEFILRHMSSSSLRDGKGYKMSCDFVIFRSRTGILQWDANDGDISLGSEFGHSFANSTLFTFIAHWKLIMDNVSAAQQFSWLQWKISPM